MYTNKWMCVCNVLCVQEYGEKANIFSSACDSLYSEIIQCKHTTMYAWKSSEAKTKRWKSIIVPKKKGKFSLFMTFNFSFYPSYHTIREFIHISVAAMFYGRNFAAYAASSWLVLNRSKQVYADFHILCM